MTTPIEISRANWRQVASQLIADRTHEMTSVSELIDIQCDPLPRMKFLLANGRKCTFKASRFGIARSTDASQPLWQFLAHQVGWAIRCPTGLVWGCRVQQITQAQHEPARFATPWRLLTRHTAHSSVLKSQELSWRGATRTRPAHETNGPLTLAVPTHVLWDPLSECVASIESAKSIDALSVVTSQWR